MQRKSSCVIKMGRISINGKEVLCMRNKRNYTESNSRWCRIAHINGLCFPEISLIAFGLVCWCFDSAHRISHILLTESHTFYRISHILLTESHVLLISYRLTDLVLSTSAHLLISYCLLLLICSSCIVYFCWSHTVWFYSSGTVYVLIPFCFLRTESCTPLIGFIWISTGEFTWISTGEWLVTVSIVSWPVPYWAWTRVSSKVITHTEWYTVWRVCLMYVSSINYLCYVLYCVV